MLTRRATLFGVTAGGEARAQRALAIPSGEPARAMRLCGAPKVAAITPDPVRT